MTVAMLPNIREFEPRLKAEEPKERIKAINDLTKTIESLPVNDKTKPLINKGMKLLGDMGVNEKDEKVKMAAQKAFKELASHERFR